MKITCKALLILLLLSTLSSAQRGFVPSDDRVYDFLKKMESMKVIDGFDGFDLPMRTSDVVNFLLCTEKNSSRLRSQDKADLSYYLKEYSFEIKKDKKALTSLFPDLDVKGHLFSDKPKYLYASSDSSGVLLLNYFINGQSLLSKDFPGKNYSNVLSYGGIIKADVGPLGLYVKAEDGLFYGSRDLAMNLDELRYNYKITDGVGTSDYKHNFDVTEGYLSAEFNHCSFYLGRMRRLVGFGPMKAILSENPPLLDYAGLNIDYGILSFSFFNAKLLGGQTSRNDSIEGLIKTIPDKYMAYHRLNIRISRDISAGMGEVIIYSRPFDISYLNPMACYKQLEHQNQDRDNSMMFWTASWRIMDGLKANGMLLLDDMNLGKIRTAWYGNQTIDSFELYSTLLNPLLPLDVSLQYLRISPYVYTHRIYDNNFTSDGYALGYDQNNSSSIAVCLNYAASQMLHLRLEAKYGVHGANPLDDLGNIIRNVGGNIFQGYRQGDNQEVSFLSGRREYLRKFRLSLEYEPMMNYILTASVDFKNETKENSSSSALYSSLGFKLKI